MINNISFFIPAYNCAKTIEDAVLSILQTNFNTGDELIIVNDCSTDETQKVLDKLCDNYPIIKCFNHSRNKGGGAARNTAIENCRNELLFCLDSDNILEKNSIKILKNFLLENKAGIATFQHLHYFSSTIDKINEIWTLPAGVFTKQDCLSKSFSPGASGNYLFTKTSWINAGGYPEFAGALDTWGFGFRQLMTGSKMMILENTYYFHRLLPESYYLRDAWNRRKSVSLRGLQLLIPFLDQIDDRDINYIFSKKGRYTWRENMEKRPIRILNSTKSNKVWGSHEVKTSRLLYYKQRFITIIKDLFK